jgi:flagellar biosynthetic protein FliQ
LDPSVLLEHARQALILSVVIALPVVGVAALVGIFVAAFQAASQIQDPTIAHLPRWLAVAASLLVMGPWIGREIAAFAEQVFVLAIH